MSLNGYVLDAEVDQRANGDVRVTWWAREGLEPGHYEVQARVWFACCDQWGESAELFHAWTFNVLIPDSMHPLDDTFHVPGVMGTQTTHLLPLPTHAKASFYLAPSWWTIHFDPFALPRGDDALFLRFRANGSARVDVGEQSVFERAVTIDQELRPQRPLGPR